MSRAPLPAGGLVGFGFHGSAQLHSEASHKCLFLHLTDSALRTNSLKSKCCFKGYLSTKVLLVANNRGKKKKNLQNSFSKIKKRTDKVMGCLGGPGAELPPGLVEDPAPGTEKLSTHRPHLSLPLSPRIFSSLCLISFPSFLFPDIHSTYSAHRPQHLLSSQLK